MSVAKQHKIGITLRRQFLRPFILIIGASYSR